MRSLCRILSLPLLVLAASAGAQTQHYPLTESITRVEVTAPTPAFQFQAFEAEAISGAYAMSNGWRMNVEPADDGIVAQIDRQRPMRLIALSPDRYATRDGNVDMVFNRGALGDEMLMSYVPDTRTAQVIVVTAKTSLAQR